MFSVVACREEIEARAALRERLRGTNINPETFLTEIEAFLPLSERGTA